MVSEVMTVALLRSKCEHVYGIKKGYKEEGYWRLLQGVPLDKVDEDDVLEEFDYCPDCGVRLIEEV